MKAAMSLAEAAAETPFGIGVLRRAIAATDPAQFPPPLRAKRTHPGRRSQFVVLEDDLRAWLKSLKDA